MSRGKVRDLFIGIVLAAAALLGALYQVNEATADHNHGDSESLPRLICPLH